MSARVTLLTDFGTADGYVAALKGVIAAAAPHLIIDDASHDVPPGDIRAAAWALDGYWDIYPPGTVHVVVVDPGVGSRRRAVVLEAGGRLFTGPDNGVFSHVLGRARTWAMHRIDNPAWISAGPSHTFHGRDIFAPAAARLAAGLPVADAGEPIGDPVVHRMPEPRRDGGVVSGVVVHVDRYGSLITNIPAAWLPDDPVISVGGRDLPLSRTYSDVASGELLALIGSRGLLEVSVRNGSAASLLVTADMPVTIRRQRDGT